MDTEAYSGVENLEVMAEARRYNEYLLSLVVERSNGVRHLVDFGAGAGTFARPLQERGYRVTAVEPDEALRSRIFHQGIAAVAGIEAIPDRSAPFIYTLNVLEHIEDDLAVLRALRRKLCPGGRLMIYVPAFAVLFSSMDRRVGHVRRYTAAQLARLLAEAELEIDELRYVDFLGFFASLLFRLFDRGDGRINRTALVMFDRAVFPVSLLLDKCFSSMLGKNVLAVARRTS